MATISEELSPDGVILIYLSASGKQTFIFTSACGLHFAFFQQGFGVYSHLFIYNAAGTDGQAMPSLSSANISENMMRNFRSHSISTLNPSSGHSDGDHKICLYMGTRRNGGILHLMYELLLISSLVHAHSFLFIKKKKEKGKLALIHLFEL